jgi:hypothetical protein
MTYRIADLYVYPVKSLPGIRVARAQAGSRGFRFDRHWMLAQPDGRFLTQRELPELVHFEVGWEEDGIRIGHPSLPQHLFLPFQPEATRHDTLPTAVWEHAFEAWLEPDACHQWFSEALAREVRLLRFPENGARSVEGHPDARVAFADSNPYMMIGLEALDALNRRLEAPVPTDRFRPNIVFSGGEAHDEDRWPAVASGHARWMPVKPCSRCQVVGIDQQTGLRGPEPLRTLADYRKIGHKIMFGQHFKLAAGDGAWVAVGDALHAG